MSWAFAWTPWLKTELEKQGFTTSFETFPDSIIARKEYWLPFLHDYLKAGKGDILVGWSSGAVAAMRYAERHKIRGSVLISPSYTDLDNELERQSGYFVEPWNWGKIRQNQESIALVYGDNDPYIPQDQFEFIAKQLNPTLIKIRKGEHFIERQEFPELLDYIYRTYS